MSVKLNTDVYSEDSLVSEKELWATIASAKGHQLFLKKAPSDKTDQKWFMFFASKIINLHLELIKWLKKLKSEN